MTKEKTRNKIRLATIRLSIVAISMLSYLLCYMCITLHNANCKGEVAGILFGSVIMGAIVGLIYTMSITWKELKAKNGDKK